MDRWASEVWQTSQSREVFFLKFAAAVVRDVNGMRDSDGLTYARKAMIRCGMALDLNGQWRVSQLFPHFQNIIAKHKEYFEGKSVNDIMVDSSA